MKNLVKLFVASALMSVMAVSAFAQGAGPGGPGAGAKGGQKGPGGPGGRRGGMMSMDTEILAKLKLTADQDKKVKALKESTRKKMEELMKSLRPAGTDGNKDKGNKGAAGGPGGRPQITPEMREKFKSVTEGYTKGLKGILTPAQYASYEKEVKAMREKMRANRPGGPGAGGPGAAGTTGKGAGKGKGKGGI